MHGMYHVVALVYVLISGGVVGNEPVKVNHRQVFATLEKCQEFLKSDELQAQRAMLVAQIVSGYKVVTPGEDPDGAETPAGTSTASCEEDDSL